MALVDVDRQVAELSGRHRSFVQHLRFDGEDANSHEFKIPGTIGYTVVGLMVFHPDDGEVLVEVFGSFDPDASASDTDKTVFSAAIASYDSDGTAATGDNVLADGDWNGIVFRNYWFPYLIVRASFDAVATGEAIDVYVALSSQE